MDNNKKDKISLLPASQNRVQMLEYCINNKKLTQVEQDRLKKILDNFDITRLSTADNAKACRYDTAIHYFMDLIIEIAKNFTYAEAEEILELFFVHHRYIDNLISFESLEKTRELRDQIMDDINKLYDDEEKNLPFLKRSINLNSYLYVNGLIHQILRENDNTDSLEIIKDIFSRFKEKGFSHG